MKLSCLLFPAAAVAREHFHGDKVFRLTVGNERQLATFDELIADFDFWKLPKVFGDVGDVRIPSEFVEMFEMKLITNRMDYQIMINGLD